MTPPEPAGRELEREYCERCLNDKRLGIILEGR
jgi:hypothetical protein